MLTDTKKSKKKLRHSIRSILNTRALLVYCIPYTYSIKEKLLVENVRMGFPISIAIPFPIEQKRAPTLIMRKGTLTLYEFYHFIW